MNISKLAITIAIILIFFSIVIATPNFTIKRNINENNILVRSLSSLGLINREKIYDGYYHLNKEIQAPSFMFSKAGIFFILLKLVGPLLVRV